MGKGCNKLCPYIPASSDDFRSCFPSLTVPPTRQCTGIIHYTPLPATYVRHTVLMFIIMPLRIQYALFEGKNSGLRAVTNIEFLEDGREIILDRLL